MFDRIDRIERAPGPVSAERVSPTRRVEARDPAGEQRHEQQRRQPPRRPPDEPDDDGQLHVDVLV